MIKLHRLDEPEYVSDEYNSLENVLAYIVSEGFMGHDTIVGYVYRNEDNKLRREMAGWL